MKAKRVKCRNSLIAKLQFSSVSLKFSRHCNFFPFSLISAYFSIPLPFLQFLQSTKKIQQHTKNSNNHLITSWSKIAILKFLLFFFCFTSYSNVSKVWPEWQSTLNSWLHCAIFQVNCCTVFIAHLGGERRFPCF